MAKVGNGWKKKSSHAHGHRQKVRTVAASDRHRLEQTTRRNTHSKDSVAEAAMDVTELVRR
jgi:acetylglutamate synthase